MDFFRLKKYFSPSLSIIRSSVNGLKKRKISWFLKITEYKNESVEYIIFFKLNSALLIKIKDLQGFMKSCYTYILNIK